MKNLKISSLLLLALISFSSCSDDEGTPELINEEEVITTVTVTLKSNFGNGEEIILTSRDLDGEGPDAPVISVTGGNLHSGIEYTGTVVLENETVSPAEVINEEIIAEADEHQFFYQIGSGLDATVSYDDTENQYLNNGSLNPVGLSFTLTAGAASTGQFTVTLRHEPNKDAAGVSEGNLTNAGGETDVAQTFNLTIE